MRMSSKGKPHPYVGCTRCLPSDGHRPVVHAHHDTQALCACLVASRSKPRSAWRASSVCMRCAWILPPHVSEKPLWMKSHVNIVGAPGVCAFFLEHSQPDGLVFSPAYWADTRLFVHRRATRVVCLPLLSLSLSSACWCKDIVSYCNTPSDGTRACIVRCAGVALGPTACASVRTYIRSTVRADVRLPSCGAPSARARGCHGPAPGHLCECDVH